ncbi:histone-lysine N-methyltransferase SETMAR-like [Halyomorpha halys]|uniref:histone-lysine N-methyltransferase SETMAR-like n=1 Tax=Halyomorpha halys TaxID=286706 RepID=UPI0034D2C24B
MDIDEFLQDAVESNPSTNTHELARECGVSEDTVSRHLLYMGKVKKISRLVPHELIFHQSAKRLEICKNLLKYPPGMIFYQKIVSCDEKWVYWHWLDRGQNAFPVAARGLLKKKIHALRFWNFEGVIHHEFVADGCSMNSEIYCEQLERLYAKLSERYPALINRKGVLFQQDKARPHTSCKTKEGLREIHGFELLPHPPYSPDLTTMAHFLQGNKIIILRMFKLWSKSSATAISKNGIEQLASRWLMVVDNIGLYFEH